MKTFIAITASAALFAVPLTAQRMGHANTNAPTVAQSISLGDRGSIELTYTSITWSRGRWVVALEDEARREQMRNTVNQTAEQAPLGTLKTSADLTIGQQRVPAGTYHLAFMLDEDYRWQLVLSNGDQRKALGLELGSNPLDSERLILALLAGNEDFTARILVAFGDKASDLPMAIAPAGEPAAKATTINTACPMMAEVVDPEITVTYQGHTIGFCCSDCVPQWNELSVAAKDEHLGRMLAKSADAAAQGFTCPMHPQIKSAQPGRCTTCGMNLVRGQASVK